MSECQHERLRIVRTARYAPLYDENGEPWASCRIVHQQCRNCGLHRLVVFLWTYKVEGPWTQEAP